MVRNVSLASVIDEFKLNVLYMPESAGTNGENIKIQTADVSRTALPLVGFYSHFEDTRIQIIGNYEFDFIAQMSHDEREKRFSDLFATNIPALIFSTNLEPVPEIFDAAKKYNKPLLQTNITTSEFVGALIASLNLSLAPTITQHGVLVEVYGEGILILGESGVGKSETAIELVKRGHRLVADDAVEIKRVSSKTLVGSAPALIRNLIELRGIGIVDVKRIFGMGAVKETERIDMVIKLELWNDEKHYDRLGMDDEFHEILGQQKPCITIPIKPCRNLAVIIEVAAMNNRQKRQGYNAATELNKRIMSGMDTTDI
jgi:HPr kinase/phosphorylase